MAQKIDFKDMPFIICGPGRVPDNDEINLSNCVALPDGVTNGLPARVLSTNNSFSMKIGGTTFDVTTHFNVDGRQNVLQQFQDLILSKNLV